MSIAVLVDVPLHDGIITQLGVAGIIVALFLQLMFKYLERKEAAEEKKRQAAVYAEARENGDAGEQSPDYWKGFIDGSARIQGEKTRELVTSEGSATRSAVYASAEKTQAAIYAVKTSFDQNVSDMKCRQR